MTAGIGHRVHRALRVAAGLSPWPAGGLVLLYHRVADLAADPQRLAVSPDRFSDHLEVLCRRGVPMSLEAMTTRAIEGTLPPNAFAITFDDGYADVLTEVAPRLRAAGVPATMFVSIGSIAKSQMPCDREFWWDELERMLLAPESSQHAAWTVEDPPPTARHVEYLDLCARLRVVSGESRERTLDALAQIAGQSRDPRASHRRLSPSEIVTLASIDGITIGSHTASHSSLANLDAADQRAEIRSASRELEALIGKRVTAFAYPFGGAADVPENVDALAASEGVTVACTTEPGSVRRDTNPLRIPRVTVRDWPAQEFESQWSAWTGNA